MHQFNLIFSHCTVVPRIVRKLRKNCKSGTKSAVLVPKWSLHHSKLKLCDFFLSRLEISMSDLILKVNLFMLPYLCCCYFHCHCCWKYFNCWSFFIPVW